jgi:hypothetical protein
LAVPNPDRIHVVKKGGEWKAEREGAKRASATGSTQGEVEKRAKEIGRKSGGAEVVVHRPDGSIRDSDTIPNSNESSKRDTKH